MQPLSRAVELVLFWVDVAELNPHPLAAFTAAIVTSSGIVWLV